MIWFIFILGLWTSLEGGLALLFPRVTQWVGRKSLNQAEIKTRLLGLELENEQYYYRICPIGANPNALCPALPQI